MQRVVAAVLACGEQFGAVFAKVAEECRAVEVHQAAVGRDVNAVAGQYVVAVAAVMMLRNGARFVQRLRRAVVQCSRVRAVVVRRVVAAVMQHRGIVLQVGFVRLRRVGMVAAVVFHRDVAEGFERDFLRFVRRPATICVQRPHIAVDLLQVRLDDVGADFLDREFFTGVGVA